MASALNDAVDAYNNALANNGFLDTTAALSGTQEAIVENIFFSAQVSLTWYDGTNEVIWETSDAAAGAYLGLRIRISLNTARRLRIKNVSGSNASVGWSGVLSHT